MIGHALGHLQIPLLPPTERWLYDLRMRLLAPAQPDPAIVMVDIDERSLADHGRWPWRRSLLADLLAKTADPGGARLIGLDLILAEPDPTDALAALQRLARRSPDNAALQAAVAQATPLLDHDRRLTDTLGRAPMVLGFHLSNEFGAAQIGVLPPPLALQSMLSPGARSLPRWQGHGGNLPGLQSAAVLGAGHLNAIVDSDGLVRQLPLLAPYDGQLHGTLALAMVRALMMQDAAAPSDGARKPPSPPRLSFEPADGPLRALHLGAARAADGVAASASTSASTSPSTSPSTSAGQAGRPSHLRMPVDAQARAWVPYSAPGSGFVRLSATDVLAGKLPPEALRGKIVLVGVSAPGLVDQRPTPVDEAMLGTLVHAHMLSAILQQRLLVTPPFAPLIEALALATLALLAWWWLPRRLLWQGAVLTISVLVGVLCAAAAAWVGAGWVIPLASLVLLPVSLLLAHSLLVYRYATGARRQLATLFGQYVPPELVQRMSREPSHYSMRSRSTELTVLFADVHGFSGLAEHMPPAELGAMMNLIFSQLTDVIREQQGTLDKYIGDSVMAFWGAPMDAPDHARRAVTAALAMRERLPQLHAALATRGWPALDINIGINTGNMVVGDMGSRHRRAYTVMGDAVNQAARIQGLCSQYGLGLVIGDATRQAVGDLLCLSLGHIKVRGRDAPIRVWHPLNFQAGQSVHADVFSREWARMRQAVEGGRTDQARSLLTALQTNLSLQPLCQWQQQQLRSSKPARAALQPPR